MTTATERDLDEAWDGAPATPNTLYEARALLIRIRDTEKERDQLKQLLAEIKDAYDFEIGLLDARILTYRDTLLQFVREHGKANIPDLARIHATTRGRQIVVEDAQAAKHVARELDPDGTHGLWRVEVSRTGLKKRAQETLEQTGELLPGCRIDEPRTVLTVTWNKETKT